LRLMPTLLHTVFSVSYYLQKLFNAYRGTESVQVTNSQSGQ
jgi:alpha-N-arabinofuranosidase